MIDSLNNLPPVPFFSYFMLACFAALACYYGAALLFGKVEKENQPVYRNTYKD